MLYPPFCFFLRDACFTIEAQADIWGRCRDLSLLLVSIQQVAWDFEALEWAI